MSTSAASPRNPGPAFGQAFLLWAEQHWPRSLFRAILAAGTWVGVACMPRQRRASREYLTAVQGRPARLTEVWRHFYALMLSLVENLRAARGVPVRCELTPESAAGFEALVNSGEPALFGSFHVGASDLLGYMLGQRQQRVSILRLRVGNDDDTRMLGERFGETVRFLWVNDPHHLIFDLKTALEAGRSVAMKCDRVEFSARTRPFRFLGADRLFPFTIYPLAILYRRPVIFCLATQEKSGAPLRVHASPVFRPDPLASRDSNLRRAEAHFQAVLAHLESLLRQQPELWFNFLPLNPVAPAGTAPDATRGGA